MGDVVFNISKGKVNEYHDRVDGNDPANSALIVVLLKTVAADATLKDQDDLAAILAGGSTECDFTNYARKTLTDASISASVVDDVNDRREADIPDQTWSSAGGAINNAIAKLLVCYDPDTTSGTDSSIVPLAAYDFVVSATNGGDITATINAAGYFRAS
jgi:hypothetical protein